MDMLLSPEFKGGCNLKVKTPQSLSNIDNLNDLIRFNAQTVSSLVDAVNGKISVTDNVDGQLIDLNFTASNTNLTASHKLNRIPVGYFVAKNDSAKIVYDGSIAWTEQYIVLKANGTGKASVYIF